MRLVLDILTAIRKRIGEKYIVGVRMVCDEALHRGLNATEGLEIAKRLSASGLIDFVNVIHGQAIRTASRLCRRSARGGPLLRLCANMLRFTMLLRPAVAVGRHLHWYGRCPTKGKRLASTCDCLPSLGLARGCLRQLL